ncbi:hypothetical protein HanRHA438_Chr09g0406871 [Helianthus annuus]|uniref:Uncharacterized protein n=1 Tax=Helianthus annuus TaxID=4232 RepID=A0A9K3I7B3_HELAN|nr:hypothetical protein HanXRQr2_Chr09g0394981 [Helianthus annuus]KAJ0526522.1 hypothetical protein HanHA300_Chr09g0324141 [Helianthus annuus]KAJ0534973.1 hypothetical protein HanIR_Chr09g0425651 [Helianthus annuus]KAJ0542915.1 hypothetical protein HanHA89_Chr09g0345051 [Helianthus annuus]KAJ0707970.1 hypothetical protein HanLR1_Chr09g0324381 [Helianthus annuus]
MNYCRGLVQLFCYRCLQMWSADCRRFTSEKTKSTLSHVKNSSNTTINVLHVA